MTGLRPPTGEPAIVFAVHGPIARDDLPGLADRVCRVFGGQSGGVAFCDVAGVPPDAVTVEALARLRLVAVRHSCSVRLCNASTELMELVAFLGLGDALTQ